LPLKVALVGCGKAAENHVSQIQHIPGVELAAVCDRELIMAEQLGARYSVSKCYSEYTAMLDRERPDVVHITTPPQAHVDLASLAFEYGCHVLIEKPPTCSHEATQRLLSMSNAAGRKLTVAWGHYFDPIAREMRELVQSGTIGEIVHLNSHFGYDLAGPFGRPILTDQDHWVRGLPSQVIYNVADHIFNKIGEYLSSDAAVVRTLIWTSGFAPSQDIASEMRVLIKDGDITATAIFSSGIRPISHCFEVFGTQGSMTLDFNSGVLCTDQGPRHRGALGALLTGYGDAWKRFKYANKNAVGLMKGQFGYFSGLQFLIRAFYRSILEDDLVPIPYDLILKVSQLTDRVLLQSEVRGCREKLTA
jgi:predicted dehydrogenase